MNDHPNFSQPQRGAIEALRRDLTARIGRRVHAEYGSADGGQHWAALCVEELPLGAFGRPGPLVSILIGAYIAGPAATMSADGGPIADGVEFDVAIRAARSAGIHQYRSMCVGAERQPSGKRTPTPMVVEDHEWCTE